MKSMKLMLFLVAALLLSACGSKLDGTYADEKEMINVTFKSNGKVSQSAMGMETEMNYEVEGNKIKILMPQGAIVWTLQDDGSILGPVGIKLTKRKK
jgi:outer membrane lipopolysaccharide assembly protein LptE/RlpB